LTDGQFGTAVTAVSIAPDQDGDADVAFYSPPLTTAGPALTTADTASADVWIGNPGGSDITVTCAAAYSDYDPATGKYGLIVMNVVRAAGALTVLVLGIFMFVMFRRERHHPAGAPVAGVKMR